MYFRLGTDKAFIASIFIVVGIAMPHPRYLTTSEEILEALEEFQIDVDMPEELISSDDDDLETRNETIVPNTSTGQNLDSSDSSESETNNNIDRVWKKKKVIEYIHGFTGNTGVVLQKFEGEDSPTDIFLTVMDSALLDHILFQTNLYINQKQRRTKLVTLNELYSFLVYSSYLDTIGFQK